MLRLVPLAAVTGGATLFWLGLFIPARGDAPGEPGDRGRIASVGAQGCRSSLEASDDSSALYYSGGCPQPMATKAVVLDELLASSFGESGVPPSVRSFRIGWARRFSEEFALRIAQRAGESDGWKAVLAKRSEMGPGDHGMVSSFVARLIFEESLYEEIGRSLSNHGAVVVAVRAEKPFIGPASLTRSAGWLRDHDIAPDLLLPLDVIVDLVLEPVSVARPDEIRPSDPGLPLYARP